VSTSRRTFLLNQGLHLRLLLRLLLQKKMTTMCVLCAWRRHQHQVSCMVKRKLVRIWNGQGLRQQRPFAPAKLKCPSVCNVCVQCLQGAQMLLPSMRTVSEGPERTHVPDVQTAHRRLCDERVLTCLLVCQSQATTITLLMGQLLTLRNADLPLGGVTRRQTLPPVLGCLEFNYWPNLARGPSSTPRAMSGVFLGRMFMQAAEFH
jgi:hypothetical protein